MSKLWHYCHFPDLWPNWSNREAGFWKQSVKRAFSLIVTASLTKIDRRAKKSVTALILLL